MKHIHIRSTLRRADFYDLNDAFDLNPLARALWRCIDSIITILKPNEL